MDRTQKSRCCEATLLADTTPATHAPAAPGADRYTRGSMMNSVVYCLSILHANFSSGELTMSKNH